MSFHDLKKKKRDKWLFSELGHDARVAYFNVIVPINHT